MKFDVYYRVTTRGVVRFESVFLQDAEAFARGIYKAEKVVSDIDELPVRRA
jgi:hypothetical protein